MRTKIAGHFKKGFLAGILVILPLFITAVVLKFLLGMVTGLLEPALLRVFPHIPIWVKTVVSIVILCIVIYLLGLTTRHFLGRWFLNRLDKMLLHIPLLNTIYGSSRDIVRIFLNPDRKSTFKEVVLVEFPGPGLNAFGFITGEMTDMQGRPCYKVFIPTTPNPTTGFLEVIEKSRVVHCGIAVEEGIKMIMSGGILGPQTLQQTSFNINLPEGERSPE
ncbi:MAG: DUF502 domain-containing protein [Planctomycetales bacterium]|nr:DUF502 domain-containing protein [Planctomycetales bacterium]